MTDYAIWLDQADIHHTKDILFANPATGIKAGDRIVLYDVHGRKEPFWLDVLQVQETGFQKHKYALTVQGERIEELREALTYHVANLPPWAPAPERNHD